MVSYISADYIYTIIGPPIKNGVIGLDADRTIVEILTAEEAIEKQHLDIKKYHGIIIPGFVNTHCHLELSNLRGRIPKHTGLPAFVQEVMKLRITDEYELDSAMMRADREMFACGIVAVGDISNQISSRITKRGSLIHYHTFVETIGFNPETYQSAFGRSLALKKEFSPLPASLTPHAPYSVSTPLFQALKLRAEEEDAIVSIHNQECEDENAFFEGKKGKFLDLYATLGLDIDFFEPSGKTSLQSYLPLLSKQQRTLLVHNTFSAKEDVQFATQAHEKLYWCLCPNANLYIENKLPDVPMLMQEGVKITLGTDSLASNDELSIFSEMMTLQDSFAVAVGELLKWATLNGAEYLGIDDRFGSLEIGKRPGINLLTFEEKNGKISLLGFGRRLY
jgi:cytosine/adenosine deaminase-related metal-dependent hydrolase